MNTLSGYSKLTLSDNFVLTAAGGHLAVGNADKNIPINNGVTCTNLKAQYSVSAEMLSSTYSNKNINFANNANALRLIRDTSASAIDNGYPDRYCSGLSVITDYTGWQMVTYGGIGSPNPYFRMFGDDGRRSDWKQLAFIDNIPTKTSQLTNDSGYVTGGPYLPLDGGTMKGPIVYANSSGNNKTKNYISAGGGYSTGSGRLGIKLVAIDQSDLQTGLGIDLTGLTYETCLTTGRANNSTKSYISFATHNTESTTYKQLGYFKASGHENPTVTFKVNGKIEATTTASSWIDGQRYNYAAFNITNTPGKSAYAPWIRQTLESGYWVSMGTLGEALYFIGSTTSRTENSYDVGFRMDFKTGYLYGSFSGNLTGNADTATKLKTSRKLWSQSFDGSADVNGKIVLSSKTGSVTSYDEGIRINSCFTNPLIHFGGSGDSGTGENQWSIGLHDNKTYWALSYNSYSNPVITANTSSYVGIRTSDPKSPLHVKGNSQFDGSITSSISSKPNIQLNSTIAECSQYFYSSNTGYGWAIGTNTWSIDGFGIGEYKNKNKCYLAILQSGNVGLSTNNPETLLDVNGVQQIYQRGLSNTAFKDLLLLKQQNSTEDANQDWTSSKPTFGIGFRRYWTSNSSPYGETTCAGIYATISSSWRGGLIFRTKNNETSGGTHDVTALRLQPNGVANFASTVKSTGFVHTSYNSSAYALTSNGGAAKISDMSVNYASSSGQASRLYSGSIGASGDTHATALQTYFTNNYSTISRGCTLSLYSSAYSNGAQYMGYFLSGYNSTPYGGFFVAHYDNPYYVGISYGKFTQQTILTSTNYSTTLDGRYYTETESDARFVNASGDSMTGPLTFDRPSTANNDYNEGARFNLGGASSWAGFTIGGASGSTSGSGDGVFSFLVNSKTFYLSHNGSSTATNRLQWTNAGKLSFYTSNGRIFSNSNLSINTGGTESGVRFVVDSDAGDFVGRYSTYVSLYNRKNSSNELKIPDSGAATIGGYTIYHSGNLTIPSTSNFVTLNTVQTITAQKTISTASYPQLICNSTTSGVEANIRFDIKNTAKGYIGYIPSQGTFLYNCASGKYLAINDSGVAHVSGTAISLSGHTHNYAPSSHTHSYLPLSGGTLTGPLEIKSGSSGNYNEGLRITCASNNWAGITFGSTGLSGAPTSGWFAALNPSDQFIIAPNDSSSTTGLTLNAGGDAKWRNYTIYHTGNLSVPSFGAKGSTTKGVYLSGTNTFAEMTYSLSATVNGYNNTLKPLAYYSAKNTISPYTSTCGDSYKPIYLSGGVPIECYSKYWGAVSWGTNCSGTIYVYQFGPIVILQGYVYKLQLSNTSSTSYVFKLPTGVKTPTDKCGFCLVQKDGYENDRNTVIILSGQYGYCDANYNDFNPGNTSYYFTACYV